jgi:membrane protein DedA with SNARE-associated domain
MLKAVLLSWVTRHGYAGLFSALVLGIVGVPVPDEMMLTFAGSLAARGLLDLGGVMAAALAGSASGITASFFLGRVAAKPLSTAPRKKVSTRARAQRTK